jgi:enterochelin esterase-like enzyme
VRIGRNLAIQSKILDREVKYSVMLPASYHTFNKDYPVIYLLHGFGGNQESWLNRCNIAQLVDSLLYLGDIGEFIYVMPDAGNSYYINSYDNSNRYYDFFIEEFVPTIDSLFHTQNRKNSRILMGLSMGGYGSIILALKNPELFGMVIALSPSVRNQEMFENLAQEKYDNFFGPVYGPGLTGDNRITSHWKKNSPYFLVDSSTAESYSGINWYIDCGLYDDFLPASEAFHQLLLQYRIPHEFHIRPGEHNWAYWHDSTINGLVYLNRKLHLVKR